MAKPLGLQDSTSFTKRENDSHEDTSGQSLSDAKTLIQKLIKHNRHSLGANKQKTVRPSNVLSKDLQSTSSSTVATKTQPSKIFIQKCRREIDSLLDLIRKDYHEEFHTLHTDLIHPDFIVVIKGSRISLHKSVFAYRAPKLYSALRAFSLEKNSTRQDTSSQQGVDRTVNQSSVGCDEVEVNSSLWRDLDFNILICCLPPDLINYELFSDLARRLYLDQDVNFEEEKLYTDIVDWLKMNKPELVGHSSKSDSSLSFCTIEPNHQTLSNTKDSGNVESQLETESLTTSTSLLLSTDTVEIAIGQNEESQLRNHTEDGLSRSLLTRAETFELGSRSSNTDTSPIVTPSKNILIDLDEFVDKEEPMKFTLITRTGLKPKQYTQPVLDDDSYAKSKNKAIGKHSSTTYLKTSSKSYSTAVKRSGSQSSTSSLNIIGQQNYSTPLPVKNSMSTPLNSKPRANVIPRAHPISLERSQSPGTTAIRSSTRDFISSNKRSISQMEKKVQNKQTAIVGTDSDPELIESCLYLVEPMTSDNMLKNIDKLSLASRSKLAEALVKLYTDKQMVDVTLQVKAGHKIFGHVCVLAARSPYLSEIINKKLIDQPSEEPLKHKMEIDLTDFSANAVNFSMMHIYSGAARVPEDIDLDELTKLSHLLHVTTLTQVCIHNLKMNLCHYFHKPCNICSIGVLKTLPIAWRYDYSNLYTKCLQWIGTYFASIFCMREFSELKPHDLVEECYKATLSQLTPDNIISKTIECQRLLKNLPRVKWTESVICLIGRQLEDFCHYVAGNYERILRSESFSNLSKNCWECEILEENLLAAMNHLKPEMGCKTLIQLHKIQCSLESSSDLNAIESYANLVAKMLKYCERYLLKDATLVVHCSSWKLMNPALQKRIKDQAIISADFDEPTKQLTSKPNLQSISRLSLKSTSPSHKIGGISESRCLSSNQSTPESRLKSPSTTYLPPPKNKTASARHVKILK